MHAFELNPAETISASAIESAPPQKQTIEFFPPDWHPCHGRRLAVFPRSLPADQWHPQGYWPDFSTLIDDDSTSQLAYFPTCSSAFSIHVIYEKCGFYRILEYQDAAIVGRWEGVGFGAALELMLKG